MTDFQTKVASLLTLHGSRIALAGLLAMLGWWLIRRTTAFAGRLLVLRRVDRDVVPFLQASLRIGLQVALLLTVLSTLGVETSSFIAVIGTAGLAVGLALQGSLANLAGGLVILAFKPFRVGDLVLAQGFTGYVEAVYLFNTQLLTRDNRTIVLPNNVVATNPVVNYSRRGTVRVEIAVPVDYSNSLDQVRTSARTALATCPHLLHNQPTDVLLGDFTDSALKVDLRAWTTADLYADATYAMREAVARQFARDGIEPPRNEVIIKS